MSAVSDMKNAVIGNNKQKANLIVLGAVPRFVSSFLLTATFSQRVIFEGLECYLPCVHFCRLLYLLQQCSSCLELRTECSVVLGSLAMGTENNIKSLVDCHIIPALLQGEFHTYWPMRCLLASDYSGFLQMSRYYGICCALHFITMIE